MWTDPETHELHLSPEESPRLGQIAVIAAIAAAIGVFFVTVVLVMLSHEGRLRAPFAAAHEVRPAT